MDVAGHMRVKNSKRESCGRQRKESGKEMLSGLTKMQEDD